MGLAVFSLRSGMEMTSPATLAWKLSLFFFFFFLFCCLNFLGGHSYLTSVLTSGSLLLLFSPFSFLFGSCSKVKLSFFDFFFFDLYT